MKTPDATLPAPAESTQQGFWPQGWWKLMEFRIGIIPLPIYVLAGALIAGLVYTGKLPNEISLAIVMFAFFGFTLAEIGKRIPIIKNIGAAAIFATFIPSALVYYKVLPDQIIKVTTDFTKVSNFLYLFIASIIVGSILSMDRQVLIKGFLKIFVPLAAGTVAAGAVGTLVGTMLGWARTTPSSSSWSRSWPAVSAKARSRCRSATPKSCTRTRAHCSRPCFRP